MDDIGRFSLWRTVRREILSYLQFCTNNSNNKACKTKRAFVPAWSLLSTEEKDRWPGSSLW
jgi:hypothetical protein